MKSFKYLFVCGALLFSCQKDSSTEFAQETEGISLQEAKTFFENHFEKTTERGKLEIIPKWETFEQIVYEKENLAYVKVVINKHEALNTEILFSKEQGELTSQILLLNTENEENAGVGVMDIKGNWEALGFMEDGKFQMATFEKEEEAPSVSEWRSAHYSENYSEFVYNQLRKPDVCSICGNAIYILSSPEQWINRLEKDRKNKYSADKDLCDQCQKVIQLSEVVVVAPNKKKYPGISYGQFTFMSRGASMTHLNTDMLFRLMVRKMHTQGSGKENAPAPSLNDNIVTIRDNFTPDTPPCAKAILKELPNLNNDIAKLLKETFESNEKYDIIFVKGDSLEMKNIDGTTSGFQKIDGKRVATIALNPSILKTATKEYILVTMYHEVIHAYLNFEKEKLGTAEFEKKYPNIYIHHTQGIYNGKPYSRLQFLIDNPRKTSNHHFKFEAYINKLSEAIRTFNPNISPLIANSMAKAGIIRPSDLFDWEVQLNKNEREANAQSKGTKCN